MKRIYCSLWFIFAPSVVSSTALPRYSPHKMHYKVTLQKKMCNVWVIKCTNSKSGMGLEKRFQWRTGSTWLSPSTLFVFMLNDSPFDTLLLRVLPNNDVILYWKGRTTTGQLSVVFRESQ